MTSRSVEPYDGPTLSAFLTARGAVLDRQSGSHMHYRLPNGQRVGSLSSGDVPCSLAREVARAFNMTFPAYRAAIGHPVIRAGSTKKGLTRTGSKVGGVSKSQVLKLAREVGDSARQIEATLRPGQRDPSVYERAWWALNEAKSALGKGGAA